MKYSKAQFERIKDLMLLAPSPFNQPMTTDKIVVTCFIEQCKKCSMLDGEISPEVEQDCILEQVPCDIMRHEKKEVWLAAEEIYRNLLD